MNTVYPFKQGLRLRGKSPIVDYLPQSYPIIVRDNMLARVKTWPWFSGFHFHTNKSVQIQPENIPFFGLYFIEETDLPDGDANVGETRFRQMARYGFSVVIQNNNATAAEYKLDHAHQLITHKLFNDQTLYGAPGALIQSFTRGGRTHQFGAIGQDNTYPIAELRFDLTCDLGVETYPPLTDDLELIHLTTQWPSGGSPSEIAATQQVQAEYDLWQDED